MIAAIPFYELRMVEQGVRLTLGASQWVIPTFGVPLDPWATLVCLGVLLGMEVARARAIRMGLDVRDVVDGIVFTVLLGFFIAHVFTVVAYFPERLREQGIWAILKVWEGFSSTGGWIGGIAAIWIFYGWLRPRDILRFADLIAFGFPIGWIFGRLGCAVVHDHIGAPTTSPLGVLFPVGHSAAGVRWELGLVEMVLTFPILFLFLRMGRKDQPPGTFLGLFFVCYAPMRFVLDFLRNADLASQDARYLGLTPAQYGCIPLLLMGAWLMTLRRKDFRAWALDGHPRVPGRPGRRESGCWACPHSHGRPYKKKPRRMTGVKRGGGCQSHRCRCATNNPGPVARWHKAARGGFNMKRIAVLGKRPQGNRISDINV